jgi:hypothetical protein
MGLIMFALSEATRTLEAQQAELNRLRDRSLSQLGFMGALVTFMIGAILDADPDRDALFYFFSIAISAAGVAAVFFTYRVWRRVNVWHLKAGAPLIVDHYAAKPPTYHALSSLASHYDHARNENESTLKERRRAFQRATYAVGALLGALIVAIWQLA